MIYYYCPNCELLHNQITCSLCHLALNAATPEQVEAGTRKYQRTSSGTPEEIATKRAQFEEDRKYRLTHSDYQALEVAVGFITGYLCNQTKLGDHRWEAYGKLFDKIEYHKEKTK